jgi:hypothetical protein
MNFDGILAIPVEVFPRSKQEGGVVLEVPQSDIAADAQEAADLSGGVVMVHAQSAFTLRRSPADPTDTPLGMEQGAVQSDVFAGRKVLRRADRFSGFSHAPLLASLAFQPDCPIFPHLDKIVSSFLLRPARNLREVPAGTSRPYQIPPTEKIFNGND